MTIIRDPLDAAAVQECALFGYRTADLSGILTAPIAAINGLTQLILSDDFTGLDHGIGDVDLAELIAAFPALPITAHRSIHNPDHAFTRALAACGCTYRIGFFSHDLAPAVDGEDDLIPVPVPVKTAALPGLIVDPIRDNQLGLLIADIFRAIADRFEAEAKDNGFVCGCGQ